MSEKGVKNVEVSTKEVSENKKRTNMDLFTDVLAVVMNAEGQEALAGEFGEYMAKYQAKLDAKSAKVKDKDSAKREATIAAIKGVLGKEPKNLDQIAAESGIAKGSVSHYVGKLEGVKKEVVKVGDGRRTVYSIA